MVVVRFVAMHGYVVAPSGSSGQHLAEPVWAVQVYKNDIQAARAALESGVDVNVQDQESSWYAYFSSVHASHQHEPCLTSAPVRKEQNPSRASTQYITHVLLNLSRMVQDSPPQGTVLGPHPHCCPCVASWCQDISSGQQGTR